MLSKARVKLIKSLAKKKFRHQEKLFVAEGYKTISELIKEGFDYQEILVTEGSLKLDHFPITKIPVATMKAISNVATPPGYLAVFQIPSALPLPNRGPVIALEDLQDPGNLGTIIRSADWFGIEHVVCSYNTVDVFNPKVVQATMGSLARVNVHYADIIQFLEEFEGPIYPTTMIGISIYEARLDNTGVLVMGSESHGLSENILKMAPAISIPQAKKQPTTESLNVAIATSIIAAQWMRP